MEKLKLYGNPYSGHAYKVALALTLTDIPYEYEQIDIWADKSTRPKAFLAASRFAEVPCLITKEGNKTQSGAILSWLACEYNVLGGTVKHNQALEWIIWEANRIGMCIPQLIYRFKAPEAFSIGAIDFLLERYAVDINRFNNEISNKLYLLGDELTIADIAVFGYLHAYKRAGVEVPKETKAWIERIENQPRFISQQDLL